MSDIITQVKNLSTRAATEFKAVYAKIGSLTSLTTADKTSLVNAINELKTAINAIDVLALISDGSTSTTTTWSSTKINSSIAAALNALTTGAPAALDTLDELAAALGDDANFASTITAALGNRVRVDTAAQGLTVQQQINARTNIDVYSKADIGNIASVDFVGTFNSGLL